MLLAASVPRVAGQGLGLSGAAQCWAEDAATQGVAEDGAAGGWGRGAPLPTPGVSPEPAGLAARERQEQPHASGPGASRAIPKQCLGQGACGRAEHVEHQSDMITPLGCSMEKVFLYTEILDNI